ncbi:MAG: FAD-dependent monooxygenase [Planctomycetes bacterium]|nr:FAD-dependent monooxygenase [Planctomycetota bacterium]
MSDAAEPVVRATADPAAAALDVAPERSIDSAPDSGPGGSPDGSIDSALDIAPDSSIGGAPGGAIESSIDCALDVAIVGAGSTGLALALALGAGRDPQRRVRIFERAPKLDALGAGLTLWSNALHVLRRLGVEDELVARANPLVRGETRRIDGRVLVGFDFAPLARELDAPCIALQRAVLQDELARKLPPGVLELGRELVEVREDAAGVELRFANGSTTRASVVIGADGVRSAVRAALGGEQPGHSGYVAYRAIVEAPNELVPPGLAFEAWGPAKRFGALRVDRERLYWFATLNAAEHSTDERRAETLLEHFGAWHAPIRELVLRTPRAAILRHPVIELARPARLVRGRIALAGDAAHAMTPNLGQGACVGLEDAWVLGRAIARFGPTPQALERYASVRRARIDRVARDSRRAGRWGQIEAPFLRALRDAAMASLARPLLTRLVRTTVAAGIASLDALD